MNTIPDLIPLHDSRPGLRSLLQVEVREAAASPGGEAGKLPALWISSPARRRWIVITR